LQYAASAKANGLRYAIFVTPSDKELEAARRFMDALVRMPPIHTIR